VRRLQTYLTGTERQDQPENIHTDTVAREMGYKGGLVYGTSVFGWATPLILEALGQDWMRDGWADVRILRPVYAGEELTISLEPADGGAFAMQATGPDGKVRTAAAVGRGRGAWLAGHHRSQRLTVEPAPDPRPLLKLATAPVGTDMPMLRAEARDRLATMFNEASTHGTGPLIVDGREVQSPASVCGRMTWYTHACWDYAGPSLHARSQVQYLDVLGIDEPVAVAGHLVSAYERNGNHYIETDGVLYGADGREVALTCHTSIFHVAKRPPAAPGA
jgi:hypothetical protein